MKRKAKGKKDIEEENDEILKGKINIMICQYARMYEMTEREKEKRKRSINNRIR